MIDALTLALTHGLMALAALILAGRRDLDDDGAAGGQTGKPWQRGKARATPQADEQP